MMIYQNVPNFLVPMANYSRQISTNPLNKSSNSYAALVPHKHINNKRINPQLAAQNHNAHIFILNT